MYEGSKNKELAAYFFKFLASDRYNELMVDGADALPPVPAFAYGEAFTHPPDYPQEWGLHEPFREQALTTGIPTDVGREHPIRDLIASRYLMPGAHGDHRHLALQTRFTDRCRDPDRVSRCGRLELRRAVSPRPRRRPR